MIKLKAKFRWARDDGEEMKRLEEEGANHRAKLMEMKSQITRQYRLCVV